MFAQDTDSLLDQESGITRSGTIQRLAVFAEPKIDLICSCIDVPENTFHKVRSPRIREGPRLDQQALSFVTASGFAEAHDDGISGAACLHTPRELGVACR